MALQCARARPQALQWLRHGCLPVPVVEGRPPAEKLAAQRARFEARNGYAGGGSQAGAAQFQRLGQVVGQLLEELVSSRLELCWLGGCWPQLVMSGLAGSLRSGGATAMCRAARPAG